MAGWLQAQTSALFIIYLHLSIIKLMHLADTFIQCNLVVNRFKIILSRSRHHIELYVNENKAVRNGLTVDPILCTVYGS